MCACLESFSLNVKISLLNVYMPCETAHDMQNVQTFTDVLHVISALIASDDNVNHTILGGDLITDINRPQSRHTRALCEFIAEHLLRPADQSHQFRPVFTYECSASHT